MTPTDEITTYAARWVVPIETPPIENGCVVVHGERIVDVGPRRRAQGTIVECGDALLMPGFVNAHVHLEFSDLRQPLGRPGMPFADWIREVIRHRRLTGYDAAAAIADGLCESTLCGVTTIGEIATSLPHGWFEPPRSEDDAYDVTAFVELLGLSASRAETQSARLAEFLRHADVGHVRRGISPHAPYTVRPSLFEAAVAASAEQGIPLAFHLAESPDELQLLRDGTGPLVDLLSELGAWDPDAVARGTRPLDYLQALSRAPCSLVVHGNYLADDEIAFVAARRERMSVVYCPRTHAYFGHPPHPLPQLLAAGANVALGTDGRSSNPDLELLDELRCVARTYGTISPQRIVRLGTIDGARALSRQQEVGSLAVGKQADMIVLNVADPAHDAFESILAESSYVDRVLHRGRMVMQPRG